MKKILAIVIGIAFAFGTVGYVAAQTPATAPKAEDKKATGAPDEKKGDKMEMKGAEKEKKGAKMEKKGAKMEKRGAEMEKKGAKMEKKADEKK